MPASVDPTSRFTGRTTDYARYRPRYPDHLIDLLQNRAGLNQNTRIADMGSGTGILSELFLKKGYQVYGLEPNEEMRLAAERLLSSYPLFTSIAAPAEQTGLPPSCVDLIVAGQAFHWFVPAAAKAEFSRIASPGAFAALIWNERREETPFLKAYDALIRRYATDYHKVNHKNIRLRNLEDFFAPEKMEMETFFNSQLLDLEGLRGRVRSSSYIPSIHHPAHETLMNEITALFGRFAGNGSVSMDYDTRVYFGRVRGA
ncbi:MAG TPA: class I SAM-dependent methyltransferase [Chitinophagaceae bacterium]|nr:class I SAM-dependent methyltransferase [Chitinophagaceae bacterium]